MTEYASLDRLLNECAMILAGTGFANDQDKAARILIGFHFRPSFIAAFWEQIAERAKDYEQAPMYSKNVVFLNQRAGSIH